MWSSKRSAISTHIRRLCTLGLPLEGIVPALMRALCREFRCEAGVVLWFDAQGEVSNLYARNLPAPDAMAAWFRPPQEHVYSSRLPVRSIGPAHRGEPVEICADNDDDRAQAVTQPEPFCPHRHLCSVTAPSSAPSQRLCSAVLRQGMAIASLMLYRSAAAAPFGSQERIAVKAAGRYLSLNGRSMPADTSAAMYRARGEQAFLLCEQDGGVIQASPNGYELLAQACGCPVNRATLPGGLERAGRQLIRNLFGDAALNGSHGEAKRERPITLINPWGLFHLRVFFEPSGPQGVLIERVEHLLVRLVEGMGYLDLSLQQGEVLLLMAQGMSHERIAERMDVSPNTADYHIRQLYLKLSAHTRDDAVAYALGTLESAH